MLPGAQMLFAEEGHVPVAFENTGTVHASCFRCALPPGYTPVGSTFTFWGMSRGATPAMVDPEDCEEFFKLGGNSDGVAVVRGHEFQPNRFSLLKEAVAWQDATNDSWGWHHYSVVFSSQSDVRLYLDGVLVISGGNAMQTPTQWLGLCGHPTEFILGGNRNLVRCLNGAVARFAVFSGVLGVDDIRQDIGLGGSPPDVSRLDHLWMYSMADEVGGWDLEPVGPVYVTKSTPWS